MGTVHTIKNESGIFRIDEKGVMLEYICNPENVFSITEGKPYDIKKLIIPEGITEIPAHAFQFFVIRSELYLPSTLKILQDLALDITSAPDIVIPQNLEYIGYAVMMRGKIKSIKHAKEEMIKWSQI